MPGLSDMEELLSRVQNRATADYMREALSCYNGAAYRACIVLSYIALFDDLRQKLGQLGVLNSVARQISREIEQRAEQQEVFESYMVDQLKAATLITEADAFRLDQIRQLRNKAAHPSGIHASPEEARYVYFETIDKFLSRPILKTTHAADGILERLHNSNFFPSNRVEDVASVAASEIAELHSLAMPYLITKLVAACEGTDQVFSRNARLFLAGLAVKNDEGINAELRNRLLTKKADDKGSSDLLLAVFSGNPELLKGLDSVTLLRLRGLLESSIESSSGKPSTQITHPANLLPRLLEKLEEAFVLERFQAFAERTVEAFPYSIPLIRGVHRSPVLSAKMKQVWVASAGSSQFDTANAFATAVPEMDAFLSQLLKPLDAFELVLAILKAANWNAFDAIALRNERFSSVPNLKSLALKYTEEMQEEAESKVRVALLCSLAEFITQFLTPESASG